MLRSSTFLCRPGTGPIPAAAAALFAVATALALGAPPAVGAATHAVSIGDGSFGPNTLTVAVGDTVTWTNDDDSPHTATGAVTFDSGNLDPGESFSFTFAEPGTYEYGCRYHEEMVATITVIPTIASSAPANVAPTAAGGAGQDEAVDGSQPDTALGLPRESSTSGLLAPLLIGLGLLALAMAVVPTPVHGGAQLVRGRRAHRAGGWRR